MRNVQMPDGSVPIMVTYRKYLRSPKLKRERKFVGTIQFVKNLIAKTLELVEEAAFETKIEQIDPGQSVTSTWGINVMDPFNPDVAADRQQLVAYRLGKELPKAGVHFEVITPAPKKHKAPDHEERPAFGPDYNPVDLSPEQFTALQRRREQQALLREGYQGTNGKFRPPPAPEYQPRRVRTIDEELAEQTPEELADENAADLDRAGRFGEDD